jgi:hypothetical protein
MADPSEADVVWANVGADGGSMPIVLLSRSRLAERLELTAAASSGGGSGWAEPAVIAAVVSGTVALLTFRLNTRHSRIDRQRQLFAVAFGAIMAYREYPHIVRRRDEVSRAAERARIGTALSDVQQQINMFAGQLEIEGPLRWLLLPASCPSDSGASRRDDPSRVEHSTGGNRRSDPRTNLDRLLVAGGL